MSDLSEARAAQLVEAARRALKALAERRQIPTPESFADVYYELNGGGQDAPPRACLREVVRELTQASRSGAADSPDAVLLSRLVDAAAAIDRQIAEEHGIRAGLLRLLGLLCNNTLTDEEVWLAGQLEPIRALLAEPLTAAILTDAERKLAGVIERQSGTRRSLAQARQAMKEMLSTLVGRIAVIGDSTGQYYEKIGNYRKRLEAATDLETMSGVIAGLLDDTVSMRGSIAASRSELEDARRKAEDYQTRLRDLERELAQVSTLVQKDPLTQALNRRGLVDAYRVESARAGRYGAPLTVVMIDVDNFKPLNDALGHAAGDRALVHLVQTLQATLRPTDQLARVGGEEFAVLLPATSLDNAVLAIERCLRVVAASPFRFERHQHLMSFSAGAALWRSGDSLDEVLKRADDAMYAAKRAGRNRVVKET